MSLHTFEEVCQAYHDEIDGNVARMLHTNNKAIAAFSAYRLDKLAHGLFGCDILHRLMPEVPLQPPPPRLRDLPPTVMI